MARNIEIKSLIPSVDLLLARALAIADGPPTVIEQDDTFFNCRDGRLKLRRFDALHGELIYYRRPDGTGPKVSYYLLSRTSDPDTLRESLAQACGAIGRVRKHRTLLMVGRTRIHLDRVEGLGDYLELEVVLADDEPEQHGVDEAHSLLRQLQVDPSQLVAGAYLDLLSARTAPR